MLVAKARNNYTGQNGTRMNCAQSVVSAFKDIFGLEDDMIETFRAYGGGRAPGGLCGAYYAAKCIIEKVDKEKAAELDKYFISHAGALNCSNVRSLKRLSCVGCVEKGSEFLESIMDKKDI